MAPIRRIFAEKRKGFDVEAAALLSDLQENLAIRGLRGVRILYRYDIEGIGDPEYRAARSTIFSEPPLDLAIDETFTPGRGEVAFAIEYLPGQYDQRADSSAQCIQLLTRRAAPLVATAKVVVLRGRLAKKDLERIKSYLINPVDSREASLSIPETLATRAVSPPDVETVAGFGSMDRQALESLQESLGLAMNLEDLLFCQAYFRDREGRDPTLTEVRVLDTYWSDHCRHTTFLTRIEGVEIEAGRFTGPIRGAFGAYREARESAIGAAEKPLCLMDIAQIGMKELRRLGRLDDLDASDEINACSIRVAVDVDGRPEEWLLMFKNETHNHPTEIEPFGGAATCLGGAIRDPLSGRAYVFLAMRVTGSGDPRAPIAETLPGKLPQRKITREAARGYSAYGNQVGLATGLVTEIFDPGYVAKRMEIGAVLGAAPRQNVVRSGPAAGDAILLVGGATGRDGIGGATGSSKAHTETSILVCGTEVQKGNPVIERKLQRLFRNPDASRLIKRCNDFGAGGVAVAVGELAPGIDIDLDAVPRKYEGLDGTELALSESQERMAVLVAADDVQRFLELAARENLEATVIARVTGERRLRMNWRGKTILDIDRGFLDSAGVRRSANVRVLAPKESENYFRSKAGAVPARGADLKAAWLASLADLNVCSQAGLAEQFDGSIGRATVLFSCGGSRQVTPPEGMAALFPVLFGRTRTAALMTFGFNPAISRWSPFHGAVYAVVEAVARLAACGADCSAARLSLQEYFEKLGQDAERWGKPFAALLGAYHAQEMLGIAAIGGKDSMSGTFKELNVPPTLVAFAVATADRCCILSPEFKKPGSRVMLITAARDGEEMPDFEKLKLVFGRIHRLARAGDLLAAMTVRGGGLAETLTKMAFGNGIGMSFSAAVDPQRLFAPDYGSLVVEVDEGKRPEELFAGIETLVLGRTIAAPEIQVNGTAIPLDEAQAAWEAPLRSVFPLRIKAAAPQPPLVMHEAKAPLLVKVKIARPRVLITVFPGSNCEYDSAQAFAEAGAMPETLVFCNLRPRMIEESIAALVAGLERSQILLIPGGFSAGDEPEGSGKFITAVFRNPRVGDAAARFLERGDGLMLGICNGFQALIKLGLLPDGRIHEQAPDSPTLTFNAVGRHVSRIVRTRLVSDLSPWFSLCRVGDIHLVPVSHGEGRFIASAERIAALQARGQIVTQYVDPQGNPTLDGRYNPNGSFHAVEALSSPDGRILGKMGHSERVAEGLFRNIPGIADQKLFLSGVHYFS